MSSKLQVRAKIIELIKKIDIGCLNDDEQQSIVNEIKMFDDRALLLQILVKELNTDDDEMIQKIAYLLLEINDFESVKEYLWDYIKDANISDRVKEISCTLLRALGEKIAPEDLLDYLENPVELIDAETKKLLDVALINPEVQIDFLDFLFALGENERIGLIKSLEEDYEGDRLVNILFPVLDATEDYELKEIILKMLGMTKSYSAVIPLQNIANYSKDERLKKTANIALKMLRIAGINFEDERVYAHDTLLCKESEPYKCFVSEIDGMGNQGVIVSRIAKDDKIQMFSTVISDIDGIVDCFGFYSLTKTEFDRVVESFDKDAIKIVVSPEYAKARLITAENISREKQLALPYEYIAWRCLIFDFVRMPSNLSYMVFDWAENKNTIDYKSLLDSEVFNLWFFEQGDNDKVDVFLSKIIVDDFEVNDDLDVEISDLIKNVFDEEMMQLYFCRLSHMAYLFNMLQEEDLRDDISFVAGQINETKSSLEIDFFKWVIRKTVYEAFLRERAKIDNVSMVGQNRFQKKAELPRSIFSEEKLDEIIENLQERWKY